MKGFWIFVGCVLVILAAVEGSAQTTGAAADFRSGEELSPVVYSVVTHTQAKDTIAVWGESAPQPHYGVGGLFYGGWTGVQGQAFAAGSGSRYGVYGQASGGTWNRGVYGEAAGGDSSTNYGVFGLASCGSGNCAGLYAGYFTGDLVYTGSLIGPPSDLMFKEYVEETDSALSDLLKLEVVTYQHKLEPAFEHMNLPQGRQTGFVAQQVAEVFPELVVEAVHPPREEPEGSKELGDPIRYKALKMTQLIPILVRAIQEQQAQIETLKTELAKLRY